jgi:hypothetical protein
MPKVTVTAAVAVPSKAALIQNLGPDILWVSITHPATANNGIRVLKGQAIDVSGVGAVSAFSAGTSDVRYEHGMSGPFGAVDA